MLSIIIGTVLGGVLISPMSRACCSAHPWLNKLVHTRRRKPHPGHCAGLRDRRAVQSADPPTHVLPPAAQPSKLVRAFTATCACCGATS